MPAVVHPRGERTDMSHSFTNGISREHATGRIACDIPLSGQHSGSAHTNNLCKEHFDCPQKDRAEDLAPVEGFGPNILVVGEVLLA